MSWSHIRVNIRRVRENNTNNFLGVQRFIDCNFPATILPSLLSEFSHGEINVGLWEELGVFYWACIQNGNKIYQSAIDEINCGEPNLNLFHPQVTGLRQKLIPIFL
jgi:hypothetical protein